MEGSSTKLSGEYENKALGPEYLELVTDLRTVINYGKYSNQVISNSPDWEGKEGETLFRYQQNGTGWYYYNYFWVNSSWSFLRWAGSSNALVPDAGSITTAMIQNGAVTGAKLNVYDSGWFGVVSANNGYSVTHNLGTTAVAWQVYYSTSSNGASPMTVTLTSHYDSLKEMGVQLQSVTTTTLTAQIGAGGPTYEYNAGGRIERTSGYLRIIGVVLG